MNIYTKNYVLEQVSPMLHFQTAESKATIRGSDLKPRFDRFICNWYKADAKKNTVIPDSWKTDKAHNDALHYKVKIWTETDGKKDLHLEVKHSKTIFHGNAGYTYQDQENSSILVSKTNVQFTCFDENLLKKIDELFPIFIDTHAFGKQNGKGYGCFKLVDSNKSYIDNLKRFSRHFGDNIYCYEFNKEAFHFNDALDDIKNFNHMLKSGNNHGGYTPSPLMKKRLKNLENEKKAMKVNLLSGDGSKHSSKKVRDHLKVTTKRKEFSNISNDNIFYTRGLLGFAQEYMFLLDEKLPILPNGERTNKVKYTVSQKYMDSEGKQFDISRVPNPIDYHIYIKNNGKYRICMIVHNHRILKLQGMDVVVDFHCELKDGNRIVDNTFQATLPSADNFNVHDFLGSINDLAESDSNYKAFSKYPYKEIED